MSGFRFSFPACVIAGKGRIDADDVLMLRKFAFPEGVRSHEDAHVLLALSETCPEPEPAWTTYFVESLANFLVYGYEPWGAIDEPKATWLTQMIATEGAVRSPLELELLLHVMELTSEAPDQLSAFALDQIRLALGPVPCGAYSAARPASPGIDLHDLAYVWRVLRGALERGRPMLTPAEVEVMRAIDALAAPSAHHPVWHDLMASIITFDRPSGALRTHPWLSVDDRHLFGRHMAA